MLIDNGATQIEGDTVASDVKSDEYDKKKALC